MKNEVIEYKEYGIVELYPKNNDDTDYQIKVTDKQLELVNKILIDTSARFVEINGEAINLNAIRRTLKEVDKSKPIDKYEDINISDEQREKNKQAIDELREQLTKNKVI